jgi:hypothetical protein
MFEHVLIRITPSGGFIFGKAKERVCPARRTNLVFIFGRGNVKLEVFRRERFFTRMRRVASAKV